MLRGNNMDIKALTCFFVLSVLSLIKAEEFYCVDGSFLHPLKYVCERCRLCKPGEYAARPCEGTDNTECLPCPNNTFSNITTLDRTRCTNCTSCFHGELQRCNRTADAICKLNISEQLPRKEDLAGLVIGLFSAGMLVIMLGAIFSVVRCRRNREMKESGEAELMNQPPDETEKINPV